MNSFWIRRPGLSVLEALFFIVLGFFWWPFIILGLSLLGVMIYSWWPVVRYSFYFFSSLKKVEKRKRIFKERVIRDGDRVLAELKYEGDHPILEIYEGDRGYLQGLILGPHIYRMCVLGMRSMVFLIKLLKRDFKILDIKI